MPNSSRHAQQRPNRFSTLALGFPYPSLENLAPSLGKTLVIYGGSSCVGSIRKALVPTTTHSGCRCCSKVGGGGVVVVVFCRRQVIILPIPAESKHNHPVMTPFIPLNELPRTERPEKSFLTGGYPGGWLSCLGRQENGQNPGDGKRTGRARETAREQAEPGRQQENGQSPGGLSDGLLPLRWPSCSNENLAIVLERELDSVF